MQYNVLGPRDAPRESTLTQLMNATNSADLVKIPPHPRNKEQTQMVLPKTAVQQMGSRNPHRTMTEISALYAKDDNIPTITAYLERVPKARTAIGQANGRGVVFSVEFASDDSKTIRGEVRIKEPMVEGQPPPGQPIVYFNHDVDPERPESKDVVPYVQARLTREMTADEKAAYSPDPAKNKFHVIHDGKQFPGADEMGFVNLSHKTLQPVPATSAEAHAKVLWG